MNFPSYIRQLDEHKPSLKMFNLDSEIDEYLEIVESENYELLMEYAFSRYLEMITLLILNQIQVKILRGNLILVHMVWD